MESVSEEVNYQKVDVDENQDLSIQYGVRNIPTLILLDETGEVKGRKVGLQTKQDILEFYNG
jgi:thioredoxin 1